MPRGAAVVYPKDAGQILAFADIFPGARVVEAGVGSGSLSSFLLRAIGDQGMLHSYERREDFAEIAQQNVERYFGGPHPAWQLTVGDLQDNLSDTDVDRVILDMLAPWECLEAVSKALVPGGIVCCYVATTTQLARTVESIREIGCFNEPTAWESMIRNWHIEGLAVRPDHRMIGHTGFLLTARRLADGVEPHAPPPPRQGRLRRGLRRPERRRGRSLTRPRTAVNESALRSSSRKPTGTRPQRLSVDTPPQTTHSRRPAFGTSDPTVPTRCDVWHDAGHPHRHSPHRRRS